MIKQVLYFFNICIDIFRCTIKKPASTAAQIQVSLNALLKNLGNRQNHYIRSVWTFNLLFARAN